MQKGAANKRITSQKEEILHLLGEFRSRYPRSGSDPGPGPEPRGAPPPPAPPTRHARGTADARLRPLRSAPTGSQAGPDSSLLPLQLDPHHGWDQKEHARLRRARVRRREEHLESQARAIERILQDLDADPWPDGHESKKESPRDRPARARAPGPRACRRPLAPLKAEDPCLGEGLAAMLLLLGLVW